MTRTHYISTSIPYVNAEPHVGFALELVEADAIARHSRAAGLRVHLQGGTDDNSLKNVRAAEALGRDTRELVAANASRFTDLAEALGVRFDDFVSTSTDVRHADVVGAIWKACREKGDLYKKAYEGLYCVGCEQFYTPSDLVDGCCPEHGTAPETVHEENWFFRLSKYAGEIVGRIERGELEILPDTRRNEVLSYLRADPDDISVSRSAARARGWGIPVPGDPAEVVYVWIDALANYLTGAGFVSDPSGFDLNWTDAARREHLVGKGITRFHAAYWPAILLSAGLPLPTRILVHGYLTAEGKKIGKSSGNGVAPKPLVEKYGRDAVRWYLLRHIRCTEDGDWQEAALVAAHDSDLAGQLGNLLNRTLSLIGKLDDGRIPAHPGGATAFHAATASLPSVVSARIEAFALHDAAAEIQKHVAEANRYIVEHAPWTLLKAADDPAVKTRLDRCLHEVAEALAVVARCIAPFVPDGAARILDGLGIPSTADFDIAGAKPLAHSVPFPRITAPSRG